MAPLILFPTLTIALLAWLFLVVCGSAVLSCSLPLSFLLRCFSLCRRKCEVPEQWVRTRATWRVRGNKQIRGNAGAAQKMKILIWQAQETRIKVRSKCCMELTVRGYMMHLTTSPFSLLQWDSVLFLSLKSCSVNP